MRPLFLPTRQARPVLWAGLALVLLGLAPATTRADVVLGNLISGGDVNNLVALSNSDLAAASLYHVK